MARPKKKLESIAHLEKKVKLLTEYELRELVLLNAYKLALARSQINALSDIIVKHKLATREEIWKLTEENFEDSSI